MKGYTIIKDKLSNIIKDTTVHDTLNDVIYRTNLLTTHVYQFLRLWILQKHADIHKNTKNVMEYNINKFTKKFIQTCFNVLTLKAPIGGGLGKESQQIYDELNTLYETQYKKCGYLNKINGLYLSAVTSYEVIAIKTSIENNIKNHFEKYIKKYVNVCFQKFNDNILSKTYGPCKEIKKKQLNSLMKTVIDDLLTGSNNSHGIYY